MQRERERDDTSRNRADTANCSARARAACPARGQSETDRPDTQNETKVDSNTAADKP